MNFAARSRVLVVSPYLPFPLSHGGAVRIYNLCRSLAGRVDFVLACFREANETVATKNFTKSSARSTSSMPDEKHSDSAVPEQVAEYRNVRHVGSHPEHVSGHKSIWCNSNTRKWRNTATIRRCARDSGGARYHLHSLRPACRFRWQTRTAGI